MLKLKLKNNTIEYIYVEHIVGFRDSSHGKGKTHDIRLTNGDIINNVEKITVAKHVPKFFQEALDKKILKDKEMFMP